MKKIWMLALVGLAVVAAACGSTDSVETVTDAGSGAGDALALTDVPASGKLGSVLLSNTLDPDAPITSARFEGSLMMVGSPGSEMPGEISIVFGGAYDIEEQASSMTMDMSGIMDAVMAAEAGSDELDMAGMFGAFFEEPLEVISIGETAWIKWGLLSMFTGQSDVWIETDSEGTGDMTESFGLGTAGTPTDLLDALAEADVDVETLGTEELRGVSVTHFRAVVDAESLAELSPDDRAYVENGVGATPQADLPLEFWIDDRGLVHRFMIDLSDPAMFAEDDEIESASLTFDMWDHGADVGIEPPPADQIITEDGLNMGFGDLDLDS